MVAIKILSLFIFHVLINLTFGREGFGPGDQEWGYVTVRPKAHMFWWLYHTTANVSKYEDKPLVIWLQGGPGVSGTGLGNFEELGPLDLNLKPRNYTWVKDYNVLFIDNPVGTGFSYVESPDLLTKNNEQIAKDLMQCIRVFFKKFPKFHKTPTYILTESYGGKMTVEFANIWYKEQVEGSIKTNFKGVGLVDSLISSNDMYKAIAPYLFYLGMIDRSGYKQIENEANKFVESSSKGNWVQAMKAADNIEYLMQKLTYHVDRLNVLKKVEPIYKPDTEEQTDFYSKKMHFVMALVKDALNLNHTWGSQDYSVNKALEIDQRKPVVHFVERLLNETNLKVYVFNGQLDIIINTPGVLSWIEKLKWDHAEKWLNAPRLPLVVNNIIEGYYKGYGNLKFYWVQRAGHMIPAENPVAMESILQDLIYN